MSYSISIDIVLIDPSEVPPRLSSWIDAADIIEKRWIERKNEGAKEGYANSTSRNWWHQHLLYLICQAYEIKGLEFVFHEVSYLKNDALFAGIAGLDHLFQRIESRRLLDRLDEFDGYVDILQEYMHAFQQAAIAPRIEQYDIGFEATVSFFAFLKTLKAMLEEAHRSGKYLLYVMPGFNEFCGGFGTEAN